MTPREAALRIVHDVAKYVARTARNLKSGVALDAELVAMLARDLYELGAKRERASIVLDELAVPIADPSTNGRADGPPACWSMLDAQLSNARSELRVARALLAEADALEAPLRAGDARAVERGAAIAVEVERRLRALAREVP
ncbi:MAG TPA: hypothetical protein VFF06_12305 [Polyangia bacterium]|nr:hypothetical protein [Polyangia bacterium]